MNKKKCKEDLEISISDFIKICKKEKFKILFGALFFGLICSVYVLMTPVQYIVKGTFKEKAKSSSGMSQPLSAANLFSPGSIMGNTSYNETISLMKSRNLLERVIKQLNLQASIHKNTLNFPFLKTIQENLKVEYAYFKNIFSPILEDVDPILEAADIRYNGEDLKVFKIKFLNEDSFLVSENNKEIGKGNLDHLFSNDNYSFKIKKNIPQSLKGNEFVLSLLPFQVITDLVSKQLIIESDQIDKHLLNIKYLNRDRNTAVKFVNTLMSVYQEYLREEQSRIAGEQITYLQQRQDEMGNKLKDMMEVYAQSLSSDMSTIGFSDSDRAMEFLAEIQNRYKNKLLEIDFELKRLQNAQKEGYAYYESYTTRGDSLVINKLLNEIRELKQYRDTIDLGLRNFPEDNSLETTVLFEEQLKHFDELKEFQEETQNIIASLEKNETPQAPVRLAESTKYIAKNWHEALIDKKQAYNEAPQDLKAEKLEDLNSCRNHYITYLQNLKNFFNLHEKMLEECLEHRQGQQQEFQGIDVMSARDLYVKLKLQLSEVETQIRQHQFIVDQMQDSNFEYSSLSQVLLDPVSEELIIGTTRKSLSLKDESNRSAKEQERLQSEIFLHKSFLLTHLKQMIELLRLKQMALKEKITLLQTETLSVAQQQISILEKHIQDYIAIRLKDLIQERSIIEQYQHDLKKEMVDLPNKWVAEKLIDLQMNMNKNMVEDVTAFVESKNISNNLEMIQSAPVDLAVPPIHPKRPRLLMFAIIGTVLGALFSLTFFVFKGLYNGFYSSKDNLKLLHQHVSGSLSKKCNNSSSACLLDGDLETFRTMMTFLNTPEQTGVGKAVLIIQKEAEDYSAVLGELLAAKHKKVLIMPTSFDAPAKPEQLPGLLQYLEKKAEFPKILHDKGLDYLSDGGVCRMGTELLGSAPFSELLQQLKHKYDYIIATSHASPASAQAYSILKYFDKIAITLDEEKLTEIKDYFALENVTFIFRE